MTDTSANRPQREENNPSQIDPSERTLETLTYVPSPLSRFSHLVHDLEGNRNTETVKEVDHYIVGEVIVTSPTIRLSSLVQRNDHAGIGSLQPTPGPNALPLLSNIAPDRKPRSARSRKSPQASLLPTPPPEPAMSSARFFIASLGNPSQLSSTRHSAGHVLLKSLQSYLSLPSFTKSKSHANGLTSVGADVGRPEYTLWQSPSFMNVSGTALLKAYKTHCSTAQYSPSDPMPGLVILYDEMEMTPSQLKVRRGATSAKGHNGIKSVQQSLQSAGLLPGKLDGRFVKIGIGIGRPAGGSRDSEDVSRYVLAQLTSSEKNALEAKVPELVNLLEQEMTKMGQ